MGVNRMTGWGASTALFGLPDLIKQGECLVSRAGQAGQAVKVL